MMTIEIDGHKLTLTTEQTEKGVGLTVTMTGGEYKDDGWQELYDDGEDGLARMLFESLAGASEAERYPTFEKWEEYMRHMGDFENIKEEGYNRSCATLKRWQKAADGLSAYRVLDYLSDNYVYNENENKFALMENQTNNNEKPKYVGITAADENSIFVWSSFGKQNFCEMPKVTDDMIVVITNAKNPYITIYDMKNLCREDIRRVIDRHCAFLSQGCSFRYKFVKRVGNCYFVN